MTPQEAAQVLEAYNQWRRGADTPMDEPRRIGQAIDTAVEFIRTNAQK